MLNIKFCVLITISKIFAAVVTFFTIFGIPLVIMLLLLGHEYHGLQYWQFIAPYIVILVLLPFCARLSVESFRSALDIANKNNNVSTK